MKGTVDMINPMSLERKHIVITGASAGIGKACSYLAAELGAKLSLIARNEDNLCEIVSFLQGDRHKVFPYDLCNIEGIECLIDNIVSENGKIDGIVHCAGSCINKPLKLMKPNFVEEIMKINFYSFVELVRCSSLKGRINEGASIVGISSAAALRGNKTQGAYAASKGALDAVIHPLAKELAVKRIRINTIKFAMVNTDMYVKSFLEIGGNNEELLNAQYLGIIEPQSAATVICFMLSDASKYMTGGTLNYDAGYLS